jgi:hypothetical protein
MSGRRPPGGTRAPLNGVIVGKRHQRGGAAEPV